MFSDFLGFSIRDIDAAHKNSQLELYAQNLPEGASVEVEISEVGYHNYSLEVEVIWGEGESFEESFRSDSNPYHEAQMTKQCWRETLEENGSWIANKPKYVT